MLTRRKKTRTVISILVALMLVLSLFTNNVPVYAQQNVNDEFSGKADEWALVDAVDSANVTTKVTYMRAAKTVDKIYFYVEGVELENTDNTFFLDTDANGATGAPNSIWSDSKGIDYKIVNDAVFKYQASDWVQVGTAEIVKTETGVEAAVDTSLLGELAAGRIKVGYSRAGIDYLPESGSGMMVVDTAIVDMGENVTPGAIEVAGILKDIPALLVTENGGSSFYSAKDSTNLYLKISGDIPSEWNDFYFDIDSDGKTGCTPPVWAGAGVDFLVENGGMHKSLGNVLWAFEWYADIDWVTSEIYDTQTKITTKIIEAAIPLNLLGTDFSGKCKVGFQSYPVQLPSLVEKMITLYSMPSDLEFLIDGDGAEWADIGFITYANTDEKELSVVQDDKKIYTLARTSQVNLNYVYYIDSDNDGSTGFKSSHWTDAGIDYKVERSKLYKYIGTGTESNWSLVGDVYTGINADSMEMSLNLKQIGKSSPDPIKIAYIGNNATYIPKTGGEMLAANKTISRTRIENTFYPEEFYGVLNNPLMGWAPSAQIAPYSQPHKLVYVYVTWRELEPEKGKFDWGYLEEKFRFNYWSARGVKVILRIVLDSPLSYTHKDIPEWLYEEISGDGRFYNDGNYGIGFSPNYSNPIIIAEHERLIQTLAEKYDSDPLIAYIALGSLGHWGEWHTGALGFNTFPSSEISDQYVQHYLDNFKNKLIGMRKPFVIAKDNKLGLFNDMIGTQASTDEWLGWIENGTENPASAMPDFWKYNYSGGEFSYGAPLRHVGDATVVETLRQIKASHTTWIGPSTAGSLELGVNEQTNIDTVLKIMGYRYVLESAGHNSSIDAGSKLSVSMDWNNKGIAPMYYAWPLELSLVRDDGTVAASTVTDADIRTWLPGKTSLTKELDIPANLSSGTYRLAVAILDPDTNKPGIDLAIEGRDIAGRYILDTVTVNNTLPSTPPPPVISAPSLSTVSISGDNRVEKGSTVQLSVLGSMSNNEAANLANATIKWSIDKENVATIHEDSGLLSAVDAGTATVTVTVTLDGKTVNSTFDITVMVPEPTPDPTTTSKFNDIDSVDWAAEAIEALADKGIISGVGNHKFAPNRNITRADFTLMVVKALELEAEAPDSFNDVPADAYYARAVGIAKKLGIISGIGNGTFGPSREISRQDMMVILAKALEYKGMLTISEDLTALNSFNDKAEVADYAKARISALIENGFVSGTGNNQITPAGKATRAQVAVLLYKLFK